VFDVLEGLFNFEAVIVNLHDFVSAACKVVGENELRLFCFTALG